MYRLSDFRGTTTAVKLTPKEQVQQRTVEQTVDDAQVQHNHKVVHVPAVMQRAVPTAQTVQKIVEVPQLQVLDKVVDRPVVVHRHVSRSRSAFALHHSRLTGAVSVSSLLRASDPESCASGVRKMVV